MWMERPKLELGKGDKGQSWGGEKFQGAGGTKRKRSGQRP